jgi:cyclophilin family peptidyl-prolyl cis-trans isomerase/HEAT repeat protein
MMRFLWLATLVLVSCAQSRNKFSDQGMATIADLQDKRQTDSLIYYLIHKNPVYRAEAALAFASVQDTTASLQLGSTLLEDPYEPARMHAAFALGQTGGYAAVNALIPALTDKSSAVIAEVLQGLGKSLNASDLDMLVNFEPRDTLQQWGQSWAFYYAGLRGVINPAMVKKATDFLSPGFTTGVRLGAAHFFNRASGLNENPTAILLKHVLDDADATVRMALAAALRKDNTGEVSTTIKQILRNDPDYRVRVNAARAAAAHLTPQHEEAVFIALNDSNDHVSLAAAEAIKPEFSRKQELLALARQTKNVRVQAALFKTLIPSFPQLAEEVQTGVTQSSNDYHKSFFISALSSDIASHEFISQQLFSSSVPVIMTASAQALVSINRSRLFPDELKRAFYQYYKKALNTNDAGVISILANALADPRLDFKSLAEDFQFLYEAKKNLSLPRDYEALQPLEEAIAYFEGREKPSAPENEFNHPLDWKLVKTIAKDQRVLITTGKGDIKLRLLVEEAPGSVANFVNLIHQKYFDNKFVHRVVPNFVMQTGCHRGDGFGNEDYSIRSEFSLRRYTTGSVGMASAGKDTEGTQWFITHSPTPHLNGRYTVFALVETGMGVVDQITVGDPILSVQLTDN